MAVEVIVSRHQPINRLHEVLIAACPRLEYGDTGCRMRHEHRDEPASLPCHELGYLMTYIEGTALAAGVDREREIFYGILAKRCLTS